jgi:glutamate racemase
MKKAADHPIGVFDSGIGGLTVVNAIHELLPRESIIYLGDSARLPYGNKSPETIYEFSQQICRFLLKKKVKTIVIACNTASAHALPKLQEEVPVPVFGVIQPGVEVALRATRNHHIGIVGTIGTIRSKAYQNALKQKCPSAVLVAESAPLFVPLIEEGWVQHPATRLVAAEYLKPFQEKSIDTLVLACTHYPFLKPLLQDLLGAGVTLVDSAKTCAEKLKEHLHTLQLEQPSEATGKIDLFFTDLSQHFEKVRKAFLKSKEASVQIVHL